ncbi:MAG TPA: cation:proton antiporter [Acidimicrobiia bacterium]|jgi:Kef-type K+ transport system membrane component KefB/glycine cleavage system regulatory protein
MDVTAVLLDILIVLVAAKVAVEIAERINVPAVVAEIVAGMIIGPSVLSLVGSEQTLKVLGELGVILLLLGVGMEMDIGELGAVGRAAMSVAVVGVVVPMVGGFAVATALGHDSNQSLFIGAALAATSVGITARVFSDLRALASVEARTVLGAAVADDVLGLVILTVVVRLVSEGSVSIADVALIVAVAVGFLVVTAVLGSRFAPRLFQLLDRHAKSAGTLVALALAFTLAFAELADAAKLAPIVGAFVAGLALSRSSAKERIERELAPVGHLFIPVFFLGIGIDVEVGSFVKPEVLGIAAALLVVAVLGKLVASIGVFGSPGDKWLIGIGMIPRGEVGLIFATIGLNEGILGGNLYAALLLVVLVTTLMTPPLLRWRLSAMRAGSQRRAETPSTKPVGGWLVVHEGTVELAADPPAQLALEIALDAAQRVARGARPGSNLLAWIGEGSDIPLRWTPAVTQQLFAVLTDGDVRAWRFLDTTGVLERALPELAEAVDRRRKDPFLLDPSHVLRFNLVERIREIVATDPAAAAQHAELRHPEWLLLAALILDTVGEDSPVQLARRIAHRLDLGAAAEQQIALLVEDSDLLRAAARKVDGLQEERVVPIAVHLENAERARALYLLSLALDDLTRWERERLTELFRLVLDLLERPDVSGLDARNLLERRRAEAIRIAGSNPRVADRIEQAPRAYLLSQDAADIARQAAFVEPVPARGDASVAITGLDADGWRIEVASRDRPGLLATITAVLAEFELDVIEATVATWVDGAALDSFVVQRSEPQPTGQEAGDAGPLPPPDPVALEARVVAAFSDPLESSPNPEADLRFDDHASPWYTICEVRSPDRRGLLRSLTAAMAAADANVHSARLVTVADAAVDRFELTDRNGRKLDEPAKAALIDAVRTGVTRKRRRFSRRA